MIESIDFVIESVAKPRVLLGMHSLLAFIFLCAAKIMLLLFDKQVNRFND